MDEVLCLDSDSEVVVIVIACYTISGQLVQLLPFYKGRFVSGMEEVFCQANEVVVVILGWFTMSVCYTGALSTQVNVIIFAIRDKYGALIGGKDKRVYQRAKALYTKVYKCYNVPVRKTCVNKFNKCNRLSNQINLFIQIPTEQLEMQRFYFSIDFIYYHCQG